MTTPTQTVLTIRDYLELPLIELAQHPSFNKDTFLFVCTLWATPADQLAMIVNEWENPPDQPLPAVTPIPGYQKSPTPDSWSYDSTAGDADL